LKIIYKILRRIYMALVAIFWMFASAPFVILIRVLSAIIVVRLGKLDIGRIGGMFDADWYLCEKEKGRHNGKYFDIFYMMRSTGSVSNRQWLKMWERTILAFPFPKLAYEIDELNRKLPGWKKYVIPLTDRGRWMPDDETAGCIVASGKPFLFFTPEEEDEGRKGLNKLGIPEGTPFVCIHNRDSAYLDEVYPQRDWSYHDYRDSDIKNYLEAAKELTKRGYYVVRIGSVVKEKMISDDPKIIDYASSGNRSDFMDVYLGAKCAFMICSETGISIVPLVFRRLVMFVNYVIIKYIYTYFNKGIIIPKKYRSISEGRDLTFREIVSSDMKTAFNSDQFTCEGVELIENTPQEILAAAVEMDEKLRGAWIETVEDKELQKRFWSLLGEDIIKRPETLIGAAFLRENRELLG